MDRERIVELFTSNGEDAEEIKNMVLAAYISLHNNTCRVEREHNLDALRQIRDALAEVPGMERYRKVCCQGIEILQKELQEQKDESQAY